MKKKLWTAKEFFEMLTLKLKSDDLLPDFLDYSSPTSDFHQIKNMDFDVIGIVRFGTNEGIYLTMYAYSPCRKAVHLGTFKTLDASNEAFHIMSKLQADFVINAREYIMSHEEDFNWEGCDIEFFRDEKCVSKLTVQNPDNVNHTIENISKYVQYDHVIVTDNESGKQIPLRNLC